MSMAPAPATPGTIPPAPQDPQALRIVVRPGDSLLGSLPLWLLCRQQGLPVLLQEAPRAAHPVEQANEPAAEQAPLTAEVILGGCAIRHLPSILEALHEAWPQAQVWPASRTLRTRAREAVLGLVRRCAHQLQSSLAPLGRLLATRPCGRPFTRHWKPRRKAVSRPCPPCPFCWACITCSAQCTARPCRRCCGRRQVLNGSSCLRSGRAGAGTWPSPGPFRHRNRIMILIVCGSPRPAGQTSRVLDLVEHALRQRGQQVQRVSLRSLALPLLGQGGEDPPSVQSWRQAVRSASALVIGSPEYHGSLGGGLKNMLDHLDFPLVAGKPAALVAAAGSARGGLATLAAMRHILRALHVPAIVEQLAVCPSDRDPVSGEWSAGLLEQAEGLVAGLLRQLPATLQARASAVS